MSSDGAPQSTLYLGASPTERERREHLICNFVVSAQLSVRHHPFVEFSQFTAVVITDSGALRNRRENGASSPAQLPHRQIRHRLFDGRSIGCSGASLSNRSQRPVKCTHGALDVFMFTLEPICRSNTMKPPRFSSICYRKRSRSLAVQLE
jgi:hypothetical protein